MYKHPNKMALQKHQHLLGVARALFFQSNLSRCFWNYAIVHAAHLINGLLAPFLNNFSPYEVLLQSLLDLENLKAFGCLAYASNLTSHRKKSDARVRKCVFIGFHHGIKGYLLFDLNTKQIFISRNVIFYEYIFPYLESTITQHYISISQNVTCLDNKVLPPSLAHFFDEISPTL